MILNHSAIFKKLTFLKFLDEIDNYFANIIFNISLKVISILNYSDTLEEEADRIALQLLARSCYDVREVEKLAAICNQLIANNNTNKEETKKKQTPEEVEKDRYIYKHAFNQHKLSFLHDNVSKFIDFRIKCGCPPLV